MKKLIVLSVTRNNLKSSLPTELGMLEGLQFLYLSFNRFTGSLPSELGRLSHLRTFFAKNNLLTGFIPLELSNWQTIVNIGLEHNLLSGTFPSSIVTSNVLISLLFSSNHLTGNLPTLFLAPVLSNVLFDSNMFDGTYPWKSSDLPNVLEISVSSNLLTGTLPNDIGYSSKLESLNIGDNYFEGTLPNSIGQPSALIQLSVCNNYFEGTLPSLVNSVSTIAYLNIDNNILSRGTLPDWLEGAVSIRQLSAQLSALEGTIPFFIGNLTRLQILDFSSNFLTGKVEPSITKLVHLKYLDLSSNSFHGTFPSGFEETNSLSYFDLSENKFTGSLPVDILCNSKKLEAFFIENNSFIGTIPRCFNAGNYNISILQQFEVSFNNLEGQIDDVFQTNRFPFLRIMDLSNNAFTGEFPVTIFQLPLVESVALNSNCFHGSLPEIICNAKGIKTLILGGLSTSINCNLRSLKPIINAVLPAWLPGGSIPSCLWSMRSLQTIHLSGNGLKGRLAEIPSTSNISDVIIANNYLSGPVPESMQMWGRFKNLDLSTNRLDGTLSAGFKVLPNQTQLNLSVNRLSGNIPTALLDAPGVNILKGNIFQCQDNNLPVSDPSRSTYSCGSTTLNYALIVWLAISLTVLISGFLLGARLEHFMSRYNIVKNHLKFTHAIGALCAATSILIATLLSAIIVTLKTGPWAYRFSTHTFQYGFIISAAYVRGATPASLVLVICAIIFYLAERMVSNINSRLNDDIECNGKGKSTYLPFQTVAVHTFNCAVVLTINMTYVYLYVRGIDSTILYSFQAFLGMFKSLWIVLVIPQLSLLTDSMSFHKIGLSLFCMIGGPVVSTLLSDASCFWYFLVGQQPILSTYQVAKFVCEVTFAPFCALSQCSIQELQYCGISSNTKTIDTTLDAGWIYSYQCSSSLVKDFSPVLITSYAYSGFLLPFLTVLLFENPILQKYCPVYFVRAIDPMVLDSNDCNTNTKVFVKTSSINCKLVINMVVLATFGAANPLLAVAVGVESISAMALTGYFIQRYTLKLQNSKQIEILPFKPMNKSDVIRILVFVVVICLLFWGIFMVDMFGSYRTGLGSIVCVLVPFICLDLILRWIMKKWRMKTTDSATSELTENPISHYDTNNLSSDEISASTGLEMRFQFTTSTTKLPQEENLWRKNSMQSDFT